MASLAAAATLVGAAPAVAADEAWERTACTSGTLDAVTVTDHTLTLEGRLDCASPTTAATFGVARYGRGGVLMYAIHMRPYGQQAPTAFSIMGELAPGPKDIALCVVTDYDTRIGCVRVVRHQSTLPVLLTAQPPDDSFVDRKEIFIVPNSDGGGSPACGGCW